MSSKPMAGEHAMFRVSAEDRGYSADLIDLHGQPVASGRPVGGVLLFNPQGNGLWVAVEDLAAVGDLLIRAHVQAAMLRVAR